MVLAPGQGTRVWCSRPGVLMAEYGYKDQGQGRLSCVRVCTNGDRAVQETGNSQDEKDEYEVLRQELPAS